MAEFGEYTVDLLSEEPLEGFTIRTVSVLHKKVNNITNLSGDVVDPTIVCIPIHNIA